jgi:hypothetical protein
MCASRVYGGVCAVSLELITTVTHVPTTAKMSLVTAVRPIGMRMFGCTVVNAASFHHIHPPDNSLASYQ